MHRLLSAWVLIPALALALALSASAACSQTPDTPAETPAPVSDDATLTFDMPPGWVAGTPASSMRVAEFTLAMAGDDQEDASMVLYFFPGGGGTVQANLDRWIGQMEQPDGSVSAEAAQTGTMQSATGLEITLVDVSGTYIAEVVPGSTERHNKPNFRVRAAVIETPEGAYYAKLTGPAATVAHWESSVTAFLTSMRME